MPEHVKGVSYLECPGPALDALVAERLLGWKRSSQIADGLYWDKTNRVRMIWRSQIHMNRVQLGKEHDKLGDGFVFSASQHLPDVWDLVRQHSVILIPHSGIFWHAVIPDCICTDDAGRMIFKPRIIEERDTAELAVCLAVLRLEKVIDDRYRLIPKEQP